MTLFPLHFQRPCAQAEGPPHVVPLLRDDVRHTFGHRSVRADVGRFIPSTILERGRRARGTSQPSLRQSTYRSSEVPCRDGSPFLLSGLVTCARCGQAYQGRTINSTKYRKDGSKIKTLYYACGGWVMKGASACEKFLIRKEPLEDLLMETIQGRLQSLLAGEGETILRGFIEDELAAQGQDPRRELATIRARIVEIDQKANVLLEGLSVDTKGFVDAKLRDLGSERRKLQNRMEALETAPYDPIDAEAVLRNGLASLRDLPRLMESASLEDRKEFVRAFVGGVSVLPDEARLDVRMHILPAVGALRSNSTCGVVAGARYEPLQMKLKPLDRFLAVLRRAA